MVIGNLIIEGKVFLAPLAGISNYPFRFLARKYGASMCYTEMISADAIVRNQKKTIMMLDMVPDEHPVGVQIFGSSPEYIARAVESIGKFKPDLIDINIGCPVKKVIKKNGGAALLKDPILAGEIMAAAVENSSLPVTIKIRSGWKNDSDIYLELGKLAEKSGISAVTLHPRSRSEGYRNKSDWAKIKLLKDEVSIPVIGNGDIRSPQDAKNMIDQTGCDAIMIGRAAMKQLYIFYQINRFLEGGEIIPDQSLDEKIELILEHSRLMVAQYGEKKGILMMRKHLAWYTKGMKNGSELRRDLMSADTLSDICRLFDNFGSNKLASLNG